MPDTFHNDFPNSCFSFSSPNKEENNGLSNEELYNGVVIAKRIIINTQKLHNNT